MYQNNMEGVQESVQYVERERHLSLSTNLLKSNFDETNCFWGLYGYCTFWRMRSTTIAKFDREMLAFY